MLTLQALAAAASANRPPLAPTACVDADAFLALGEPCSSADASDSGNGDALVGAKIPMSGSQQTGLVASRRTAFVIAGVHRSGTSALARVIHLAGARLPRRLIPAAADNVMGFWESQDFVRFNDRLLAEAGATWSDWLPLDEGIFSAPRLEPHWPREAQALLAQHFGESPWIVLKDPRMSRLLRFWQPVLDSTGFQCAFLVPLRPAAEVAASLSARNGLAAIEGKLLWLRYLLDVEASTRGAPRCFLPYERLLAEGSGLLKPIADTLGWRMPESAQDAAASIDAALLPELRHHLDAGGQADDGSPAFDALLREAWTAFAALCDDPQAPSACSRLDRVREALDQASMMSLAPQHPPGCDAGSWSGTPGCGSREWHRELAETTAPTAGSLLLETRWCARRVARLRAEQRDALSRQDAERAARARALRKLREEARRRRQLRLGRVADLAVMDQATRTRLSQLPETGFPPVETTDRQPADESAQARQSESCDKAALLRRARHLLDAGLFDGRWYLLRYPAVAVSGAHPLRHWLERGWREGRDPNPLFESALFRDPVRGSPEADRDPLSRWLEHWATGRGRTPPGQLRIDAAPLFDLPWYLSQFSAPDVEDVLQNPLGHYLRVGQAAGIGPNAYFDPEWYLARYPDVKASGIPPLHHFLIAGAVEGRRPGPHFNTRWYMERYPDVAATGTNPLRHFLTAGQGEGRLPVPPARTATRRPEQQETVTTGTGNRTTYHAADHTPPTGAPEGSEPGRSAPQLIDARTDAATVFRPTLASASTAHLALRAAGANPSVSVIMPTWNRSETVLSAIDSVIAQRYPHWELIVCDDGSTDDTAERIANRYAPLLCTQQMRYLQLPHRGAARARNAGLAVSRSPLIAYLDSDNRWHHDFLLMLAGALVQDPAVSSAYGGLHVHDGVRGGEHILCEPFRRELLLQTNFIDVNVFCHRRELFEQLGGFDESLDCLEDWDLALRYTQSAAIRRVPYALCEYFINPSLDNVSLRVDQADSRRRILQKWSKA